MLLYQLENGYCYNSDTHFLYNFILEYFNNRLNIKGELLDVGSGSGVLGLLIARDFQKINLSMSEIQESMKDISIINARVNNIKSKIYFGDYIKIDFQKKFDFIISNPPFYHKDVIFTKNSVKRIARYNDNLTAYEFIKKSNQLLTPKGILIFCYDAKQIVEIFAILKEMKLNIEIIQYLHPKKDKEATIVFILARKSSKSLTKIKAPIIMFENDKFTQQTIDVYNKTRTHSIKCKF